MQTATFTTSMGDIVIQLDNTNTPNTVANFTKLAGEGFYNGTKFHRVIAGFMIQGGDPLSKKPYETVTNKWGTGGPGYEFADEIKPTNNNIRGTISMANAGPNTNGSQFFINVADNTYLNPKHTVFGTVTKGMDVVDAIANTKTKDGDQPIVDVVVQKNYIRINKKPHNIICGFLFNQGIHVYYMSMKLTLAIIAACLAIIGNVPYLRDVIKG
jgi:peptidylprolyl isomerase